MLSYIFKPLEGSFPRELLPTDARVGSPFRAKWASTLEVLERELDALGARDDSLVLQTAHAANDVRRDGQLRGDVRAPEHPGVVIAFDVYDYTNKRWVPMSFECDSYFQWKDNVRAIALAMEALRKVDRYGVSSRGKQKAHYEGYKALPSAEGKITSVDVAAKFISEFSNVPAAEILGSTVARDTAYRRAALKLHPDRGGNMDDFVKLQDSLRMIQQQN